MTIEDGVALLRSSPALAGPVATFDLANPFNALLRRVPPRGDNSWNHYGRTFSETVHPAPEDALRDVAVIMVPKIAIGSMPTVTLMAINRDYMARHFRVAAAESRFWRAYARSRPGLTGDAGQPIRSTASSDRTAASAFSRRVTASPNSGASAGVEGQHQRAALASAARGERRGGAAGQTLAEAEGDPPRPARWRASAASQARSRTSIYRNRRRNRRTAHRR